MVDAPAEMPSAAATPRAGPRHGGGATPESRPDDEMSANKRRKVRRGTRSCWECKRRKTRCTFASSDGATCTDCRRRGTACISQDMPEDLATANKSNRHLGERIAKLEDLMRVFLDGKEAGTITQDGGERRRDGTLNSDVLQARSINSGPSPIQASLRHTETPRDRTPVSPLPTLDWQAVSSQPENDTALDHLRAAFPAERDARILLQESSRWSLYTDIVNTQPHSKMTHEALAAPQSMRELSELDTHPVILARRMLLFAITLQSQFGESMSGLSEPQSLLMRRLVTAVATWVTAREEMHGTVDCLVCIILEGVFETKCGNLRRAWAVYRRAMTVAQLMGLHRSPMPPLKRIDPELDVDPEFLWFRIVYMDRCLSLLLGLPQGTPDTSMGTVSALRHEPPLGKFDRLLTVIASRILERNQGAFAADAVSTTQSIDSELLKVSQSMPTSFWRPANFQNIMPGSPDTLLETVRVSAQVYYYGLVVQLHLPYMMRLGDSTTNVDYSKMSCVNASREIMTRFIAHRSFNPTSTCSRPVDFFAVLAATTLVLAHLDTHHCPDATNVLAHQRLTDRALLEQAVDTMDMIRDIAKDIVTEKSAILIRRLLDMEADAADGSSYTARRVGEGNTYAQEGREGIDELRLRIPCIGLIKIARQGHISREPWLVESGLDQAVLPCPSPSQDFYLQPQVGSPSFTSGVDEWTVQGVDVTLF